MWTILLEEGHKELSNLPLMLLQYTAILGMLSMLLAALRPYRPRPRRMALAYGLLFGITGYLLIALVAEFIQSPSKPYVRNDLLFLAALLGGWRGGAITLALVLLARIQFGGAGYLAAAAMDMVLMSAAGLLAHRLIRARAFIDLGPRDLLALWLLRVVSGLLVLIVTGIAFPLPPDVLSSGLARRAFGALPALALLAGLVAILRLDARHHQLEARERQRRLRHPLTGLANRHALLDHLNQQATQHPAQAVTLVLIEVSNYVEMLLAHGHAWADKVWQELAHTFRTSDLPQTLRVCHPRVFQFSETALSVTLQGVDTRTVESHGLALQLQHSLNRALRAASTQDHVPLLRLSVLNISPRDHDNPAHALRDCSLLLQDRIELVEGVRYCHETFARQARIDAELLRRLMLWIDGANPPMAYQPQFRLSTQEVEGAEALLRAEPIGATPISPLQVLSLATRHQLLAAFEWSTVQAVVRDATRCQLLAPRLSLSVNISGASLALPGFAQRLQDLLRQAGLPRGSITLELTESAPLPDVDTVKANLQLLHAGGVPVALDDFGSGYSGLSVLAQHPFAEVKIDHTMVAMMDLPRMRSAIQLALETARRYDARFVAEGVETQAQCDTLVDMGIDTGQGHFFAGALRIEDFLGLLRGGALAHPLAPA